MLRGQKCQLSSTWLRPKVRPRGSDHRPSFLQHRRPIRARLYYSARMRNPHRPPQPPLRRQRPRPPTFLRLPSNPLRSSRQRPLPPPPPRRRRRRRAGGNRPPPTPPPPPPLRPADSPPAAPDRGLPWPIPNSNSPPSFGSAAPPAAPAPPPRTAALEALPATDAIRGPIPLPRHRPGILATAASAATAARPTR